MKLSRISQFAIGALVLAFIIHEIDGNVHDFDGNDLNPGFNGYASQRQQQQQHQQQQSQSQPSQGSTTGGRGFVDTAKDLIGSPAGQLAMSFAKEMISRSAGNSQVLSLNLTNLLILFLLKALIFAAGLIGAGSWGGYARGRSIDDGSLFYPGETSLMVGYLAAEGSGQEGCLLQSACRSPHTANEYSRAAQALVKGAEIFDPEIPKNVKYNRMLAQLERSISEGLQGAPCEMIYPCHL
ncbi:uncharacterized protein LOC129747521 [Uranotaenia lowii]|uniref:uncharacterized protein LOC129747521 n=1 Tax=Uranotaenia lowii TaxID=190385 RepID=UPI002479F96C|nr:uncharacterized protein LOC129747521 [Uranotaenia lowii]